MMKKTKNGSYQIWRMEIFFTGYPWSKKHMPFQFGVLNIGDTKIFKIGVLRVFWR